MVEAPASRSCSTGDERHGFGPGVEAAGARQTSEQLTHPADGVPTRAALERERERPRGLGEGDETTCALEPLERVARTP